MTTPTRGHGRPKWYVSALPAIVILAPAVLSLLAWFGPIAPGGLTGYHYRAGVSGWGVALVIAWFGALVVVAQYAFTRGRRKGPLGSLASVTTREVHVWTCTIGLIGTAWAYWVASGGSAAEVLQLWRTQQFNTLRAGFDYGVGVPTLRYAAIIAGALSIAHLAGRGRVRVLDVVSLGGLIAAAFLASRLSLVAAGFVAITIIISKGLVTRLRPTTILLGVLAAVALFTALNYSRSAGTYREAGVSNPAAMAAINAQAYLAAPTQVTLGVATLAMDDAIVPSTDATEGPEVLLPTYANALVQAGGGDSVSTIIEVSPDLTTNGALPKLLLESGWIALASALVAVGVAAWAAGRFLLSEGIGPAMAGVLLYAMAELWRLFFFNQGIFHFLVLIGIAALVVGKLREPMARSGLAPRP
jgi:hypothetical protein